MLQLAKVLFLYKAESFSKHLSNFRGFAMGGKQAA